MMRRTIAIRHDNNGDVTLLGPALRALATRSRVALVCAPSGEGAARLLPGVAQIRITRAEWIAADPQPIERARIEADVALYADLVADEAFVFTSFHQSPLPTALLLRLAGVANIAAISVDYPGSLLDTRVHLPDDVHEVERSLALVGARGYVLPEGDDGRLRYRKLPHPAFGLPTNYIAFQPGATVPARAWSPEKSHAFVRRLVDDGYDVAIVGSAAERDLGRVVAGDTRAIDLTGRTSYAEFAAVIRDARALVVGNSSGIHVAGAVGTPVVSIFPPTIPPVRFAPWRVAHVLLGDHAIACAGCRARDCPVPGQPCIGNVSVADVVRALQQLGAEPTRGRAHGPSGE